MHAAQSAGFITGKDSRCRLEQCWQILKKTFPERRMAWNEVYEEAENSIDVYFQGVRPSAGDHGDFKIAQEIHARG